MRIKTTSVPIGGWGLEGEHRSLRVILHSFLIQTCEEEPA